MARKKAPIWNHLRDDYPGLSGKTYLDTGSFGLMASSTVEVAEAEREGLLRSGSERAINWMMEGRSKVTAEVAAHLHAETGTTVLFQSFTAGLTRLAPMLRNRKKVLLVEGDYPTLHGPFLWNGFEVVIMKTEADGSIPLEKLDAAMAEHRPSIVAISHVQWLTGYMIDLGAFAELCRKHEAWSLVDITQSWCVIPIDLRTTPVDLIGGSGYKWPLAGFGNGFFHLASHVRDRLERDNGFKVEEALSAGHFDPMAMVCLSDALSRSLTIGVEAIAERVRELGDRAVEKLEAVNVRVLNGTDAAHRAGILIIEGDAERLEKMRRSNIRAQLRGAGIRVGVHFYNNDKELDKLADVLEVS